MATTLKEFLIEINVDVDDERFHEFNNFLIEFDKRMTLAGFAARSFAIRLGILGAAAASTEIVLGGLAATGVAVTGVVARMTTGVLRQARAANISAEASQTLRFALQRYQISADKAIDVTGSLAGAQKELREGQESTTQAAKALGLNTERFVQLKPWQAFQRVADAVQNHRNQQEALVAVQEIFGETLGAKIIPLLQEGSGGINQMNNRFEEFGAILSEGTLKAFQELLQVGMDLWIIFRGMARTLAKNLLPYVYQAAVGIREWFMANEELINQELRDWAETLGSSIIETAENIRDLVERVQQLGGLGDILITIREVIGTFVTGTLIATAISAISTLGSAITTLGSVIAAVGPHIRLFFAALWGLIGMEGLGGAVATLTTGLGAGLLPSLGSLAGALAAVIAVGVALSYVLEDIWTWIRGGGNSVTGAFIEWISELEETDRMMRLLAQTGDLLFSSLKRIAAGLGFVASWSGVTNMLSGLLRLILKLINVILILGNLILTFFNSVLSLVRMLGTAVGYLLRQLWNVLKLLGKIATLGFFSDNEFSAFAHQFSEANTIASRMFDQQAGQLSTSATRGTKLFGEFAGSLGARSSPKVGRPMPKRQSRPQRNQVNQRIKMFIESNQGMDEDQLAQKVKKKFEKDVSRRTIEAVSNER